MNKGVLCGIVCVGLLFSMLSVAPPAKAVATSQELSPNVVYANSFDMYTSVGASTIDVLSNRTAEDVNLYNDFPGVLAWTADAADDGDFGTAYIELGLEDPVGELSDYYSVRVYVKTMVFDAFLTGSGSLSFLDQYTWAWLGLKVEGGTTTDLETYWPTDTNLEYVDASGTTWYNGISLELAPAEGSISWINPYIAEIDGYRTFMYHDFDENPLYERPWTLDEVNNMRLYGEFGWSSAIFDFLSPDGTIALALAQYYVEIFPADYSEPANPVGSFILRPDADRYNDGWVNESGNDTGLWASLDETTRGSDWALSYIYTNDNGNLYYGCTFTDPPSWAADTTYAIYPWMILQTETYEPGAFWWYVAPLNQDAETLEVQSVMDFYCNRSETLETVYETGDNWHLDELTVLTGALVIEAFYQLNMSQFAVLCVPLTDVIFGPTDDEGGTGAGIFDFVVSGSGIMTIFGVIGFFGMIAVPVVAVYASRESGVGESFLSGFILFILFLGFFLAGVFAGG